MDSRGLVYAGQRQAAVFSLVEGTLRCELRKTTLSAALLITPLPHSLKSDGRPHISQQNADRRASHWPTSCVDMPATRWLDIAPRQRAGAAAGGSLVDKLS